MVFLRAPLNPTCSPLPPPPASHAVPVRQLVEVEEPAARLSLRPVSSRCGSGSSERAETISNASHRVASDLSDGERGSGGRLLEQAKPK